MRRAQTMLEYIVLLGILVVALLATSVVIKRSWQGRLKGASEQLTGGGAYSPRATQGSSIINISINESSNSFDSKSNSESNIEVITNKYEEVLPFNNEPQRFK